LIIYSEDGSLLPKERLKLAMMDLLGIYATERRDLSQRWVESSARPFCTALFATVTGAAAVFGSQQLKLPMGAQLLNGAGSFGVVVLAGCWLTSYEESSGALASSDLVLPVSWLKPLKRAGPPQGIFIGSVRNAIVLPQESVAVVAPPRIEVGPAVLMGIFEGLSPRAQRGCAVTALTLLLDGGELADFQFREGEAPGLLPEFFEAFSERADSKSRAIYAVGSLLCGLGEAEGALGEEERLDIERKCDETAKIVLRSYLDLEIVPVEDNGDCFFDALGKVSGCNNLREQVAARLQTEFPAEFASQIRYDASAAQELRGYPRVMREKIEADGEVYVQSDEFLADYQEWVGRPYSKEEQGIWGGVAELQHILPNVIGKSIAIYSAQGILRYDPTSGPTEEKVTILFLASKLHYEALVPASN
jgi:hypothetical protein